MFIDIVYMCNKIHRVSYKLKYTIIHNKLLMTKYKKKNLNESISVLHYNIIIKSKYTKNNCSNYHLFNNIHNKHIVCNLQYS